MLTLKPNCERCDKDLPNHAADACICTYECTFCRQCVDSVLKNVCPNCGGGFAPRPIRPKVARRKGVSLVDQPASRERVITNFSDAEIRQFVQTIKHIPASER